MTATVPQREGLLDLLAGSEIPGHQSLSRAQCEQLVRRYGTQSSAYFNLQSDVQRFGAPGLGFIAYAPVHTFFGRVNIVFSNPVCGANARLWLLRECIRQVPGAFIFSGIDAETANDLETLGYSINGMGSEFRVRIPEFSVAGKHKKQLRHASNLGHRHGLNVLEQRAAEVDLDQLRQVSENWRRHKTVKRHELRLLTRPPVLDDEWGVRKFYAYQGSRLLGCVFFDPFFDQGRVVGYTANILRQDPENSPSGLLDYIILRAMDRFREEGIEYLSLGISPLHNVRARPGDSWTIRKTCQMLYEYGNDFYAFKALAYHKTRYRGEETPWYLATRQTPAIKVAWSMLRGTGIVGQPQLNGTRPCPVTPLAG